MQLPRPDSNVPLWAPDDKVPGIQTKSPRIKKTRISTNLPLPQLGDAVFTSAKSHFSSFRIYKILTFNKKLTVRFFYLR
jgi:hypothetical protein